MITYTLLFILLSFIVNIQSFPYSHPYETDAYNQWITTQTYTNGTVVYHYYDNFNITNTLRLEFSGGSSIYKISVAGDYVNSIGTIDGSSMSAGTSAYVVFHTCNTVYFSCPTDTTFKGVVSFANYQQNLVNSIITFRANQQPSILIPKQGNILPGTTCLTSQFPTLKGPYYSFGPLNISLGPVRIIQYIDPPYISVGIDIVTVCQSVSPIFDAGGSSTDRAIDVTPGLLTNNGYYVLRAYVNAYNNCSNPSNWANFYVGICQGVNCTIAYPGVRPTTTTTAATTTTDPTTTMTFTSTSSSNFITTSTHNNFNQLTNAKNSSTGSREDVPIHLILILLMLFLWSLMQI